MNRPASLLALFLAFTRLALQGFGGVLAVAQRELVERLGWLSKEEFVEALAIAQVLPGPNVVNLSMMIGDRFFGLRGAIAVDALRGTGAVSAGLILATGIKLLPALKQSPLGRPLAIGLAGLAFVLIGLLRWPLLGVLALLGGMGMALAWWKLK